jgi:hypothetical protein
MLRRSQIVNLLRRYWIPGLVVFIVLLHAAIVGYVRRQIVQIRQVRTGAVTLGTFRVQPLNRLDTLYQMQLHAELEPSDRVLGEALLRQQKISVRVAVERVLRESMPEMLEPASVETLTDRLMDAVSAELGAPVVRRLWVTDWLILPVDRVLISPESPEAIAARL